MPRLDVRVNTNLPAKAVYYCQSSPFEESVQVRQLSLSGGLLAGFTGDPAGNISLRVDLCAHGVIALDGEPVKSANGQVAVRFSYPSKNSMASLWKFLRGQIEGEIHCPYCSEPYARKDGMCIECGQYLNFDDSAYLEKHMKNTFIARIKSRLNKIDVDFMQRIINFVDTGLLDGQDAAKDEEFVGTSPNILEVFSMIRKAAGTDMNVLVLGESGTGKELTAKAIHERSDRKDKPFVAINCAAIPDGLLEAELFGYERGAFTGAYTTKIGKFETANSGSIFLDEIGDLSPNLQAKLLRFIEDRIVERVGGKKGKKVDVRVIAATNCDLSSMVDKGDFRSDLFFRLNSFTIKLPPLRDRGDDKVILAKYFFKKFRKAENSSLEGFSESALNAIREYRWPGNVRGLINKVRRGLVMASGPFIEPGDMELDAPDSLAKNASVSKLQPGNCKEVVFDTLTRHNFVISQAARDLRVSRPTLYTLIKKYEIEVPSRKPGAFLR
jgi:transcriptional regulator with PAS, ATPase and Fis domain